MADNQSRRRYMVDGNLARAGQEVWNEPAGRSKKKRATRVLPRTAVDVMSFAYITLVAIACACILLSSVTYVHAKTSITSYSQQVVALQKDLAEVKKENKKLQNEIATSTDLNTIKEKAKDLGMSKAGKGQIIYYEQSESEYVRQKEDIPND